MITLHLRMTTLISQELMAKMKFGYSY